MRLYDVLLALVPTPVVELNRAVAVSMAFGSERGLALVDEIVARGELDGYHLLHSTRAEMLDRLGRSAEAAATFAVAARLSTNEVERTYLLRRRDETATVQ